ncbi:prolipoprotein diacylglyceryl transferase [Dinghuibacter silviterrae]|uniref:Prolipoprotein diacylglyceryl transferase n=1 Tax=Dinghuibacter silviterrae TaxID=1539049 RepID=A0A4R8DV19_9BACT|nr:prolipoprotein diacylglyceryl transferase family protein [Dinghuibacter silviterrae]TDX02244.1 prolipoprotein diacylglyceryl transferase [Dinghuibacter silviterrae]
MYPNLYFLLKSWFGVEWPFLRLANSFGFFVAIAFIGGAFVLSRELKRKEAVGLLSPTEEMIVVGNPATWTELIINFIIGFLFGYKIVGFFVLAGSFEDTQAYILSTQGNFWGGLLLGAILAFIKWRERHKQQLPKPEERKVRIYPHDRVGDMVIIAVIFGFAGAKVFHILENWEDFTRDPASYLSFSGLTFYGGLIVAGIAVYRYARKYKIGFKHLLDAFGPTMMLAYALGRIGCQVAGDGDWGIANSAYISNPQGQVVLSDTTRFREALQANAREYKDQFGSLDDVPHKSVVAPSWVPTWLVAYNYPHNVLSEGVRFQDCKDQQYCSFLPVPVFPTPFYETVTCLLLFGGLMALRKKILFPGGLFAVYLVMNGIERFLVETIRVNTKYDLFGIHPTQAELISLGLVIAGVILWFYWKKLAEKKAAAPTEA